MRRLLLLTVMFVLAAGSLFAQGLGGGMTPGAGQGGTILVNTPKGLFALRNGVLAKYNATTLKLVQELPLFGAAPVAPADNTDRAAMMKYFTELQRRQAPAIMLAKDDSLLLVIGDGFARINQETLKPEAMASLAVPGATADATQPARTNEPTPGYTLSGDTLFLMRGTELIAITITDGKILSRVTLPKELQPIQTNFGGRGGMGGGGANGGGANGGGGNRGGGANGGNRGGNNGAGGNGGGFAN